ncbi:MAG: GMC oxidoreductase [Gemmatimonadaceae bacterium]
MKSSIVVVGSGPSGVHFALTVLQKGHRVTLLDVGREAPANVRPSDRFNELKANLHDPVEYFLGPDLEAMVSPGLQGEYYAFPPSKRYVFVDASDFGARARGFSPLFSHARGGLAQAWTGGVYPFNDDELRDFPFSYADIEPCYSEVARRIGISGVADDLARFHPVHEHIMEPLRPDLHSEMLLAAYDARRAYLNHELRAYVGRSRIATLTRPSDGREACSYLGRCLWGCPTNALYTPAATLRQCERYPGFRYHPGVRVSHFRFDARRRITSVFAEAVDGSGGQPEDIAVDTLVLAAGTLASSKIFMESVRRGTGEILRLPGLMDNQQILVPFLTPRMLGTVSPAANYQYHQVGMGFVSDDPREFIHGQITTLTTALVHPIIQRMPFDLATSARVFRNLRSALGMVNVNLHDTRRADSFLTLENDGGPKSSQLVIEYAPPAGDKTAIRSAVSRVKKALRALRCIPAPGMTHVRPKGASVHYAGTIPMGPGNATATADTDCRSNDFQNLLFVDGTTFPFLPAKNITFSLMANAVRVARAAF